MLMSSFYSQFSAQNQPSSYAVTNASSATVSHNFGYKPFIWFVDSNGVVFTPTSYKVTHNSDNQFTVDFGETVTLTIMYAGVGGTSYFSEEVDGSSTFTKTHNLGYYPEIFFTDANNVVLTPDSYQVTHNSTNQFTVDFGETVNNLKVFWR